MRLSRGSLPRGLRLGLAAVALTAAVGCVHVDRQVAPQPGDAAATLPPAVRLAAANDLFEAGCFDCLTDALHRFSELRADPDIGMLATRGAVKSAALLAARARELSLPELDYLQQARDAAASVPGLEDEFADALDMIAVLPGRTIVASAQSLSDGEALRKNRQAWSEHLTDQAALDPFFAYAWLSLSCSGLITRGTDLETPIAAFGDLLLIRFRSAICPRQLAAAGTQRSTLQALRAEQPRFAEIAYFLGLGSMIQGAMDAAEPEFQKAYEWQPAWPVVTVMLGHVAMGAEDFERALSFYERTITLAPGHGEAMLGKVRALSYLGRAEEGIAAADEVLAANWNRADAFYWRAWNEFQLARHDVAWATVQEAEKLLINADVSKLAGLIAARRSQPAVAQGRLELSLQRRNTDCETRHYLGIVHAEQRHWVETFDAATAAAACFDASREQLTAEIESINASGAAPERKARQVASRERQLSSEERLTATSWFNAAVAAFNLSRRAEAETYAAKVADDEQFGERARVLLERLRRR